MVFWGVALLIAATVAGFIVAALRRARAHVVSGAESDMGVYRDQLAEVERDLARGVLTEVEAASVRTEVSRRLLEADRRAAEERTSDAGTLPATIVVLLVTVAGGAWLYSELGAPGYPDLPMAERLAEIDRAAQSRIGQVEAEARAAPNMPAPPPSDARFTELMAQLRATLEERPNDIRGWTLLAENEARLGNFPAAREAQSRVIELKGEDAGEIDYVMAIDIMVFGAGGYISPEAETLIRQLLDKVPTSGPGRYYAGLTLVQVGRPDQAFPIWRRLLEESTPDAPWVPVILSEIEGVAAAAGIDYAPPSMSPALPGPSADDMAAAEDMTDEDRAAMIRGMVDGLSQRLATEGGTPEEWARLITALGVLGDTEQASAILLEARQVFAEVPQALQQIEGAAARAGLE